MSESSLINIQIADLARQQLDAPIWGYLAGGAEDEIALRRNRSIFQTMSIVPRVLSDTTQLNMRKKFWGIDFRIPVIAAPIGGLVQFHEDGDIAWAQGLAEAGIVGVTSGVARIDPREIAANADTLFYQLYPYGDSIWMLEQIQMAVSSGYKAIVVTVDVPYLSIRERDRLGDYDATKVKYRYANNPPDRSMSSSFDWAGLSYIIKNSKLPVIIKGIMHVNDAEKAIQMGAQGVWISNHGGRQLDKAPAPLSVLPKIASVCRSKGIPVILDGGIRRGSDILLATILGADIVAVGRLPVYGLATNGKGGVAQVFDNLTQELRISMGLAGISELSFKLGGEGDYLQEEPLSTIPSRWDKLEAMYDDK
jgi:isopentenyl diphosphate isomerase/L-lactate dehydrogenase-like FMN-dependent dehydrogenase